jgi:hypothetical protein
MTLPSSGSGYATTVVIMEKVAKNIAAASTNLTLLYPPCGAEIICHSSPHRDAHPWHPPYTYPYSLDSSHVCLAPELQKIITVILNLRLLFSNVYSSVLRRIGTIAITAILHGLLDYLLSHGQPRISHSISVSSEVKPIIGNKNYHTISTTVIYAFGRITDLAFISQRLPLHTVNYSQLPYRYGTDTNS